MSAPRVIHGDCIEVMRGLPDASVDAVVTDPPYGLEFMGKEWDKFTDSAARFRERTAADDARGATNVNSLRASHPDAYRAGAPFQQWCELWATECLRVLKPGGHLLAFGGTRTWHRLACAVEDAGFEVRDSIAWLYGSGFPKSLDVSKAIDKAAGAERTEMRPAQWAGRRPNINPGRGQTVHFEGGDFGSAPDEIGAPATDDARTWQGWGTALKPAFEPIVVARKPLTGTVAANVLTHGTGALNVDGCRIEGQASGRSGGDLSNRVTALEGGDRIRTDYEPAPAGRWPANVVLDESQAAALDQQSGELTSRLRGTHNNKDRSDGEVYGAILGQATYNDGSTYGDSGGASRFFYTAKADAGERVRLPKVGATGKVAGTPGSTGRRCNVCGNQTVPKGGKPWPACGHEDWSSFMTEDKSAGTIAHPTVKPLALMRWLVRLVTPPGGTVLEPFAGSGTTVEACLLEGFGCIAIEREADYLPLIQQRIDRRRDPVAAVKASGDDAGLFDLLDEEPA